MDCVPASVGQINQSRHWSGILMGKFAKSRDNIEMRGRDYWRQFAMCLLHF